MTGLRNFHPCVLVIISICMVIAGYYLIPDTLLLLTTDSLSYLSIAKLYAAGDWWNALNAYWSPAFSILLSVCYTWDIDPLYGGKWLMIIASILSVWIFFFIADACGIHRILNLCLCTAAAIVLMHPAIANFTPDVLCIPLLLGIVLWVIKELNNPLSLSFMPVAVCGATGYYAKQYVLFFFLIFITLFTLYQFATKRGLAVPITRRYIKTLLLFVLLISPWILLLSIKYGRFTYSSAAAYNLERYCDPTHEEYDTSHYKLHPLPYPKAVSFWDDPTYLISGKYSFSKLFKSETGRTFFLKHLNKNYESYFDLFDFLLAYHLFPILFLVFCFLLHQYFYPSATIRYLVWSGLAFSIYLFGYIMITDDYRYAYFPLLFILLWAAFILQKIIERIGNYHLLYAIAGVILIKYLAMKSYDKTMDFKNEGLLLKDETIRYKNLIDTDSNVCTIDMDDIPTHILYTQQLKHYGYLKHESGVLYLTEQLKRFQIQYVFSAQELLLAPALHLIPISNGNSGWYIYEVAK